MPTSLCRPVRAAMGGVVLALTLTGCGLLSGEITADVGECITMQLLDDQFDGAEEGELTGIPTVGCSEEHDGQVIHVYDIPGSDWPGTDSVHSSIEEECLPAFEDYVGTSYGESDLDIYSLTPIEQSWDEGDREVICIAYLVDGSTTTETFEDSGL